MHTVETKVGKQKHTVTFYDSDRVLPHRRYHRFKKYYAIALQVGDTIEDYDKRQTNVVTHLRADDKESAIIEVKNQRQCFFNMINEYSPKGFALAIMVHSIDGVVYSKYEESDLDEILDKLDEVGYTKAMLDDTVHLLKKK